MRNTIKVYIVRVSMIVTAAAAVLGVAGSIVAAETAEVRGTAVADTICPVDMHWSVNLGVCVTDMHW